MAHHSFPQGDADKLLWLSRFAAFAVGSGIPADKAQAAATGIARQLPVLSPDQEEAAMRDAGFDGVSLFYAAFTFRGWVAYAS